MSHSGRQKEGKQLESGGDSNRLTGRIGQNPHDVWREEVLEPQLRYESCHLLPHYLWIEKALLAEHRRMGLINPEEQMEILSAIQRLHPDDLRKKANMHLTDMAFTIEGMIADQLSRPVPAWHVDRSRNDYQATAQMIESRERLLHIVGQFSGLITAVLNLAESHKNVVMPGYTHYQAAQVISPAFYLSAFLSFLIQTKRRLLAVYDDGNRCPLGSGAMAGQELEWDRNRLARHLGFAFPVQHALHGVASREWILRISGEFSLFATSLSRFITDFTLWGSNEYDFIDLPDELSGISSSMPQKKNFPILERIRGRTAHLISIHIGMIMGQRNTPYSNLVEVSKEASTHLPTLFQTVESLLRLLTLFMSHLRFKEASMRLACEKEFLGGFSLANALTLEAKIPYRHAQVIAGKVIVAALKEGRLPKEVTADDVRQVCAENGYDVQFSDEWVQHLFDVDQNLMRKCSLGSTHPERVQEMLDGSKQEWAKLEAKRSEYKGRLRRAAEELDRVLAGEEAGKR
jgi:argininosuccinate lyase